MPAMPTTPSCMHRHPTNCCCLIMGSCLHSIPTINECLAYPAHASWNHMHMHAHMANIPPYDILDWDQSKYTSTSHLMCLTNKMEKCDKKLESCYKGRYKVPQSDVALLGYSDSLLPPLTVHTSSTGLCGCQSQGCTLQVETC